MSDSGAEQEQRAGSSAGVSVCVLLAGGLKPSPLVEACGCSTLDLQIDGKRTLFEVWIEKIARAFGGAGRRLSVSVVYSRQSPRPERPPERVEVEIDVAPERRAYRGPAGVVFDAVGEDIAGDDGLVFIADVARAPRGGLGGLLETHRASGAEATVGVNADGSPAGVYLAAGSALRQIQRDGYMDIKEQWLPRLRDGGSKVWTHRWRAGEGFAELRTREQLLRVAGVGERGSGGRGRGGGRGHGGHGGRSIMTTPVEGGEVAGSVIGPGAEIAETSVVLDSLVMEGARVGPGALVVRSVLSPGARVESNAACVDSVVKKGGVVSVS